MSGNNNDKNRHTGNNQNNGRRSNPSGRVALCGLMAALSGVCLLLTIIPAGTYALPALAGAVLIPVVIELGIKSGLMTYAAVALLAVILPVDITGRILFIAFFGYYPIVKCPIEKWFSRGKHRIVEWLLKLGIFNASVVGAFYVLFTFMNLDNDMFILGGFNLVWVFLLIGNIVFVIYDLALTRSLTAYITYLHPRVSRMFKL